MANRHDFAGTFWQNARNQTRLVFQSLVFVTPPWRCFTVANQIYGNRVEVLTEFIHEPPPLARSGNT